jgi:hypothetical protein
MPKTALLCFLAALAAGQAEAAGSNIALSDYPGPQCSKPERPVQPKPPPDENAAAAVAGYNAKVKQYNQAIAGYNSSVTAFNACMQTYIQNGNADMMRIKQRLDQAVAAANGP